MGLRDTPVHVSETAIVLQAVDHMAEESYGQAFDEVRAIIMSAHMVRCLLLFAFDTKILSEYSLSCDCDSSGAELLQHGERIEWW